MSSPSGQLLDQCLGFPQWQQTEKGIAPLLQPMSMSIGTPIEIFAGRAITGAPDVRPHTVGTMAGIGSRAGA